MLPKKLPFSCFHGAGVVSLPRVTYKLHFKLSIFINIYTPRIGWGDGMGSVRMGWAALETWCPGFFGVALGGYSLLSRKIVALTRPRPAVNGSRMIRYFWLT